ncbi:MAG: 1,4-dihydroxy-2-naphthoate polyprenyltransferase [Verrucomicrobia bacterium]|nr:MAG: 1,4-dihydroxy-2-naphthoate polyprenyltransferase [Verrucomicrobiota bacterium]
MTHEQQPSGSFEFAPASSRGRCGLGPWIEAARPKTLPAAVVPVLVGSALAWRVGNFAWLPAGLCLVFALLVQIGTNYANDYGDFVAGADGPDRRGPRRAVAAGLITPAAMKRGVVITFAAAFLVGLSLIWWGGWVLLPIGIASLLFGWAYTAGPWPLAYHGLGDIFVFVFFGLVAVGGTFYVMAGRLVPEVVMAAVPVGLLATNLLVVNNCRDRETDARANKRTLVVRLGYGFGVVQYAVSLAVAAAVPVAMAVLWRDAWIAVPVVFLAPAIGLVRRLAGRPDGPTMNGLLAGTAKVLMTFGLAWAAVLAFA